MALVALIKFTQGMTTAPAGQALVGVTSTPVVLSNGDNSAVKRLQVELLDVPGASGLGPTSPPPWVGLPVFVQDGAVLTYTFTPDVAGTYLFRITTYDQFGNTAQDVRAFMVPEGTGLIVPSYRAPGSALNAVLGFGPNPTEPNERGWATLLEQLLGTGSTATNLNLSGQATGTVAYFNGAIWVAQTLPYWSSKSNVASGGSTTYDGTMNSLIRCKPTSAACTVNVTSKPADGACMTVGDFGNPGTAGTHNINLANSVSGMVFENPYQRGTYNATAAISQNGDIETFTYVLADNLWKAVT